MVKNNNISEIAHIIANKNVIVNTTYPPADIGRDKFVHSTQKWARQSKGAQISYALNENTCAYADEPAIHLPLWQMSGRFFLATFSAAYNHIMLIMW